MNRRYDALIRLLLGVAMGAGGILSSGADDAQAGALAHTRKRVEQVRAAIADGARKLTAKSGKVDSTLASIDEAFNPIAPDSIAAADSTAAVAAAAAPDSGSVEIPASSEPSDSTASSASPDGSSAGARNAGAQERAGHDCRQQRRVRHPRNEPPPPKADEQRTDKHERRHT